MSDPPTDTSSSVATGSEPWRRLEDWVGVLAAVATILLSLAIAALILERGSSASAAQSAAVSQPASHRPQ